MREHCLESSWLDMKNSFPERDSLKSVRCHFNMKEKNEALLRTDGMMPVAPVGIGVAQRVQSNRLNYTLWTIPRLPPIRIYKNIIGENGSYGYVLNNASFFFCHVKMTSY